LLAQASESAGAGPGGLTVADTIRVPAQTVPPVEEDPRPNIVLITTDDQRLRDLRFMPNTRRLLVRQGTSFTGIAPHPLCCPARAQLLTGQYAHNNGVRTNHVPWGGYAALDGSQILATWLTDAGYRTVFLGKYLNGYRGIGTEGGEPGWRTWHALVRDAHDYWGYVVRHNRSEMRVTDTYLTDHLTDAAVRQIRRNARETEPFFLWQSYVAPHAACPRGPAPRCWSPPPSAPRHRKLFTDLRLDTRKSPAFNEVDVTDKPLDIQQIEPLDQERIVRLVKNNRMRLRSLRAVDDGVAAMVTALQREGELDNTLIIFTSDNGYLLGQHRLGGKTWGYEPSLRVPFVLRGPGIPTNHRQPTVATLLDVPATTLAVSGAIATLPIDGQSLLPLLEGAQGQDTVLILGGPRKRRVEEEALGWFYHGVRTDRYTYIRYDVTGEEELYDRSVDPDQVQSVHDDRAYARTLRELRRRTDILEDCAGAACHQSFGDVPGPEL
jgi:arylsulfatase A-like enzyme